MNIHQHFFKFLKKCVRVCTVSVFTLISTYFIILQRFPPVSLDLALQIHEQRYLTNNECHLTRTFPAAIATKK